jgi:CheY-like chemotaxis protein
MRSHILALNENDDMSRAVVHSLGKSGHDVILAGTFGDAIVILNSPRKIDLVISDVHLENGGNVFDFLRWVKDHSPNIAIPFVLLSCKPSPLAKHLEDALRTSARLLGASKYISMNTFDSDDFCEQIDSLLEEVRPYSTTASKASLCP